MVRYSRNKRYMDQKRIDYIQKHGSKLTIYQLAEVLGFSKTTVWAACQSLEIKSIRKKWQPAGFVVPPLEDNNDEGGEQPMIIEGGTKYNNTTRDELINKYLKMDI